MNLLAPLGLLAGLLAIPILIMYMLKLRRRETTVSSILLWQQVLRDRQANSPWQRLRRNLLLFLQLSILAGLVFALARPAVPVPNLSSGATVILLDGSASMNALESGGTRFDAARRAAQSIVDNLAANTPVTIILAGDQPVILAAGASDREMLRHALAQAQPAQGKADWQAALALAAGIAGRAESSTVIISDGGIPRSGMPALPGKVRYLKIGTASENLAVSALAVRATANGAELFASIANYGTAQHPAILSIYSGDRLIEARPVDPPTGGRQDLIFTGLPASAGTYTARITPPSGGANWSDALPLDDSAATVYRPARSGRALLVSRGNLFLKQLLNSLSGLQPFEATASGDADPQIPTDPYDLYVLDGIFPKELPKTGSLLIVNPPSNDLFAVTGSFTDTGSARLADSPLTRYVEWGNVHVAKAQQVTLPAWAEPLIQSDGGALVFAGEKGGRRVAVVTFDLHDSDLPLQVTFPVLFSNLIQYLARPENLTALSGSVGLAEDAHQGENLAIQPGERILIHPAGDAADARVAGPDGSIQTLVLVQGQAIFSTADRLGVYRVSYPGHPDLGEDAFSIDLFSAEESNVRPRDQVTLGQQPVSTQPADSLGQRELWPWLAGLALALLLVEWAAYHRQGAVGGSGFWQESLRRLRLPRLGRG